MAQTPHRVPDPARYARHIALAEVGAAGQQRLADSSVLVVGAGGLGSPAALYLAAAGVGTIGLADHDRVEISNLQRQVLFATDEIGQGKAVTARARLTGLNPSLNVIAHAEKLVAGNVARMFRDYDVIIDGTDRLATRYLINDACVMLGKPLVSAAIHRFEGQAMTYVPGSSPCYRCLYPESPEDLVPNCATAGVLGVLPGVMGSIQATEALKLLLGIGETLAGRLLVYDALSLTFDEFRFARRTDCAVCGAHPTITSLAQHEEPVLSQIEEWSPQQLAAELKKDGEERLFMVDVREPHEWEAGRLPGSVHIPLGTLPARMGEIPADVTPVFICAAGGRSMRAAQLFVQARGHEAINLGGGVMGWSQVYGAPPQPDEHRH
ncbi:MAG TPA: molybdopterin-synthase adenylyltransferase MoeB [Steroidobacteraceae bacterium]|nr:molybdopterin-synthase adenylyltransferase MoeB [Steroidobacteraceae bacterium]